MENLEFRSLNGFILFNKMLKIMALSLAPQILHFHNECPFCMQNFECDVEAELNQDGLSELQIHPHHCCPEFKVYVDPWGKIRGTLANFY